MKWALNITRFILALFVPGFVFIFISTKLNFDAEPFTLITVVVSGLFAGEVLAWQRGERYIWAVISRSAKDKVVFVIGLFLFGVFSAIPEYLDVKQWVSLVVVFFGLFVMFAIGKLFGSKEMNEAFIRRRKSAASELNNDV